MNLVMYEDIWVKLLLGMPLISIFSYYLGKALRELVEHIKGVRG
jgi:hypothetical protein